MEIKHCHSNKRDRHFLDTVSVVSNREVNQHSSMWVLGTYWQSWINNEA